jgi:hypothetical protein
MNREFRGFEGRRFAPFYDIDVIVRNKYPLSMPKALDFPLFDADNHFY